MLNDRLTPLEQLRTCLNERASTRDENIKQLSQVIQEVAVISPRLQQLELKCSRPRCGFSALTWTNNVAEGETISPYKDLYSNVGGNFDAKSGIFTAPVDGLYVTAISLRLSENEELTVYVKHNKKGLDQSSATDVCRCSATVEDTHACDVSVLDMKAGDTLVLFLETDNTDYENCVSFSCFLLS
ncbi:unnamed protein product [Candidula unifasciata]|uniref:C1q domain-containing protein n=1 Tax=Candidula unifasciata TaxID=100452 RepID=A0A8S3ZRJ0_9EUPU|nr:unnamed protein product [Candidula unifasciata]